MTVKNFNVNPEESNYLQLMSQILSKGNQKEDRTGTGTHSVFGASLRFNLAKGFPLLTTKKVHLRSIVHELLWFLKGDTNTQYLRDNGVTIWDEWADEEGNLGPVYGKQWTDWIDYVLLPEEELDKMDDLIAKGYDYQGNVRDSIGLFRRSTNQIEQVMNQLRNDPDSRRIYVSAINVGELDQMALEPCHNYFQFYTRKLNNYERFNIWNQQKYAESGYTSMMLLDDKTGDFPDPVQFNKDMDDAGIPQRELSCFFLMRSTDVFLGLPFNIASYAMLTHMMAQQLNMTVGELLYQGVDVHLYNNHEEQALTQIARSPYQFPQLKLRKAESIFDYKFEDFEVVGYESYPGIKAPVAI